MFEGGGGKMIVLPYPRAAMHSISTRAPFGSVFTATAERAGKGATKNCE